MKSARSLAVGLLAGSVVAVYFIGIRPRLHAAAAAEAAGHPHMIVNAIVAQKGSATSELILPANLQAFQDSPIYARTTGYLAKFLVDIGDTVTAGQTIAIIDSPEIDRQYTQVQAALAQAKANAALAKATSSRWTDLAKENAVSKQESEEKSAAADATAANVQAAEAEMARLKQLKDFETVTSPFDGVVSARGVDVGTLITTDASRPQLFRITQQKTLRVYVNIPQAYVRSIRPGLNVDVLVAEFPERTFSGKIVRAAGALDSATRTQQVEVQLPNDDNQLIPGMFVQVRFRFTPTEPPLLIPSNAAIIRADGTSVAVIDAKHTIHIQKVKLGRDYGTQIEVLGGLTAGSMIASSPSDQLVDGLIVEPALPEPAKK